MRRVRFSLALAAGLALACPAFGQTLQPFTIDTLLQQEALGAVRISPDSQWIAYEQGAAYDTASTFRFGAATERLLSTVVITDPVGDVIRRVGQADGVAGFSLGPFSPDSRRLVIYRLTADRWTLGILSLETGDVVWTDHTPEESQFGRTLAWRTNEELVFIDRGDDSLPVLFRVAHQAQDRTTALWAATALGDTAGVTYIPSGEARDSRAQPPALRFTALDVRTGQARVLAAGAFYDVLLSPDGRSAAVLEEREDIQPSPDVSLRVGEAMRRRALRLVDLETEREIVPDRPLDLSPYFLAWSSDSQALLAFARTPGEGAFEQTGGYVVVSADGAVTAIDRTDYRPRLELSRWDEAVALGGWRGSTPVLRVSGQDGAAYWRSLDGAVDMAARPGDRLVDWAGELRVLRGSRLLALDDRAPIEGGLEDAGDAGDAGSRSAWTPSPTVSRVLRQGDCFARALDSQPRCVRPLSSDESVVAVAPSAAFVVARQDSATGLSSLRLHHPEASRTLTTVNTERADLDWGEVLEIPHAGPNGEALKSWLLLPAGLPADRRANLVVDVYVGRTAGRSPAILGRGSRQLQNNPAVLAGAGYAVLLTSVPNPPDGRYDGAALAERLLEIIDAAGRTGRVDAERVALIGHSYGAFNVLSAASHSPRFGAVIASNGFADLSTGFSLPPFYRTAPQEGVPIATLAGWSETGQGAIGRFPAQADAYVALSPLYAAETLTAPTLLIETDLDRPRFGSLFGVLYRLDREAALLTYYGEGHTLASPGNLRDLHARIVDWLDRYLGPAATYPALPVPRPDLQDGG